MKTSNGRTSPGDTEITFSVLSAYCRPLQSHRLHLALLYPESVTEASGRPSTWEVLSATIKSVTASPHAAIEAGPTARGYGVVMIP